MTPCPASAAPRVRRHRGAWLLPLLATLGLAACGGGDAGPADGDAEAAEVATGPAMHASGW